MTCIVGHIEGATVWMGADSAGSAIGRVLPIKQPKVFRKGEMLIGMCGSFRMGQLLEHHLELPEHPEGVDTFEYLVRYVVEAIRDCFKAGGFATRINEQEEGGFFMVGYRGRLFVVEADYQVIETHESHVAIGCGQQYAWGALAALEPVDIIPKQRVEAALLAAARYDARVAAPYHILSLE